jgi:hypothetical protein
VDSLGIRLVGNEWVREWTLLRTTRRKRRHLVIWTDTSDETSTGTLQTRETIEQPCSNVLAHTPTVCKGTDLYNRYLATRDDRDSWGTWSRGRRWLGGARGRARLVGQARGSLGAGTRQGDRWGSSPEWHAGGKRGRARAGGCARRCQTLRWRLVVTPARSYS